MGRGKPNGFPLYSAEHVGWDIRTIWLLRLYHDPVEVHRVADDGDRAVDRAGAAALNANARLRTDRRRARILVPRAKEWPRGAGQNMGSLRRLGCLFVEAPGSASPDRSGFALVGEKTRDTITLLYCYVICILHTVAVEVKKKLRTAKSDLIAARQAPR